MNDSKALPGRRKRQRKLMDDGGLQRELIYDGKALPPTKKLFTTDQKALHHRPRSSSHEKLFTTDQKDLHSGEVLTTDQKGLHF